MNETGYSMLMDVILFLALVGTCVVILGPAITGHATERSMADRGMRELAADLLSSLESEQADYFEYRIMGDMADTIASAGGINDSADVLYKDLTRALLGRGSRHMTTVDVAAGAAACEFSVGWGGTTVRMNPITAEYESAAAELVDRSVRSKLDARYRYEFTLRWRPLAGVPVEGEVGAGDRCPAGAASASMLASMPYTTNVTGAFLACLNERDLDDISRCIDEYRADGDPGRLKRGVGLAIEASVRNTTSAVAQEIWNNTLGTFMARDLRLDPAVALERLSGHDLPDMQAMIGLNTSWEGALEDLAIACYSGEMLDLTQDIVDGVTGGSTDATSARSMVLDWLGSRYQPSAATVTVSVWT